MKHFATFAILLLTLSVHAMPKIEGNYRCVSVGADDLYTEDLTIFTEGQFLHLNDPTGAGEIVGGHRVFACANGSTIEYDYSQHSVGNVDVIRHCSKTQISETTDDRRVSPRQLSRFEMDQKSNGHLILRSKIYLDWVLFWHHAKDAEYDCTRQK